MSELVAGITIPDSKLAREAADLLREHGTPLLFTHSIRVYFFGALRGRHRGLKVDGELLYVGAMFHDLGLTPRYRSPDHRFEIDGANAARDFLRAHGMSDVIAEVVWDAIALHTTPEIAEYKRPEIALLKRGAELEVVGRGIDEILRADQEAVLAAYPRIDFKCGITRAFLDGFAYKPTTTIGTWMSDVLERNVPGYRPPNACDLIAANPLPEATSPSAPADALRQA